MTAMSASFFDIFWTVLAVVGSVGSILALLWMTRRDGARDDEDAARAFFDRHGRWPDEEPAAGPTRGG